MLEDAGGQVTLQPAIKIEAVERTNELADVFKQLARFDWITFSSANGVRFFMEHLFQLGKDVRNLAKCRIAAVGPATAAALAKWGITADLVPDSFHAQCLVKQLLPHLDNRSCLVVRGTRSRGIIERELSAAAIEWTPLVVYSSVDIEQGHEEIVALMQSGQLDWTFVTSPAIASSLAQQYGETYDIPGSCRSVP